MALGTWTRREISWRSTEGQILTVPSTGRTSQLFILWKLIWIKSSALAVWDSVLPSCCPSWFQLHRAESPPVQLLSPTPRPETVPAVLVHSGWTNGLLPEVPWATSTVTLQVKACSHSWVSSTSGCIPSMQIYSFQCCPEPQVPTSGMFCITTAQEHPMAASAQWSQQDAFCFLRLVGRLRCPDMLDHKLPISVVHTQIHQLRLKFGADTMLLRPPLPLNSYHSLLLHWRAFVLFLICCFKGIW